MTGAVRCRKLGQWGQWGRGFTVEEIAWLCETLAGPPLSNRHALAQEFCRRIGWIKPDVERKDIWSRPLRKNWKPTPNRLH